MGRYFGIFNKTQKHYISQGKRCWKSDEWCDCHSVMHEFGWNPTDIIASASYCDYCKFVYDPKENKMKCIMGSSEEDDEYQNNEENKNEDNKNEDNDNDTESSNNETTSNKTKDNTPTNKKSNDDISNEMINKPDSIHAGFSLDEDWLERTANHVPKWDGNTCLICGYTQTSLAGPAEPFDPVFFCG